MRIIKRIELKHLLIFGCIFGLNACFPEQKISQTVNIMPPESSVMASQNPEEAAIIQVIQDNANFLNSDSLSQYQSTLHPESEFQQGMPDFFYRLRQFRTIYNVLSIKVQSLSRDIASVDVKRKTTDYSGTVDQSILYTIRKDSLGNWKIYSMVKQEETRV